MLRARPRRGSGSAASRPAAQRVGGWQADARACLLFSCFQTQPCVLYLHGLCPAPVPMPEMRRQSRANPGHIRSSGAAAARCRRVRPQPAGACEHLWEGHLWAPKGPKAQNRTHEGGGEVGPRGHIIPRDHGSRREGLANQYLQPSRKRHTRRAHPPRPHKHAGTTAYPSERPPHGHPLRPHSGGATARRSRPAERLPMLAHDAQQLAAPAAGAQEPIAGMEAPAAQVGPCWAVQLHEGVWRGRPAARPQSWRP